jgi:hypothetical protein
MRTFIHSRRVRSGLVVTGTYSNGTEKAETVTLSNISGYDANTTGQQTLPVPAASWSAGEFVNWHHAGKPFTKETPVSGDTTVYAKWLISTGNIADYLNGQIGGESADDPLLFVVNLELAAGGWESLLSTIASSGKYVSLDLSACTMDGTEFDPGTATGADKITALVLPDAAESIKAGADNNATFKAFTGLTSISGAGVETIGDYAFLRCTDLTEVSLPAAPPSIDGDGAAIFRGTGSSGTIVISVPPDAVSAYTTKWDVSAETAAGGNISVYGSNHKAVLITDKQ